MEEGVALPVPVSPDDDDGALDVAGHDGRDGRALNTENRRAELAEDQDIV